MQLKQKKEAHKILGLLVRGNVCVAPLMKAFLAFIFLWGCNTKDRIPQRPLETWAFRSVLDRKPRMLTIALDTSMYVAYDLATSTLYKAWKGGVSMEGTAYTDKKNVQPTSWGQSYVADSTEQKRWVAEVNGKTNPIHVASQGYFFKAGKIYLKYALLLLSGDSIHVEESPEYTESEYGDPVLQRKFRTRGVPQGTSILLHGPDTTFRLNANEETNVSLAFKKLPGQIPPEPEAGYDHRGRYWMEKSDCLTCHEFDKATVGPSFQDIAEKYPHEKTALHYLARKVKEGGAGVWGTASMNPHPSLSENEIKVMLDYILSLKPDENGTANIVAVSQTVPLRENIKPGFGAPLESVHPSYDVYTIRNKSFKPRVGGLAFLPDGRLLVTTWDVVGGVYVVDGVETGDTSKITVKRIASGLSEPLGIEVVDGQIYVLQKHELTRLIDLDGDDIIDEYRAVYNRWGVSGDFHEFAFGLVYKDGYFYATLSMAMRLMSEEKQQPDRGKTIRISKDGREYEWINYGLRTPNGIGLGVDNEIFVTDNQGEWLPANKLIHVQKGQFLGMPWGLPDSISQLPETSPPAIWLPQDEIGNSPSEPVLMRDGPYKGQMLHGDVTHGGIKRDFLEKVNGHYQGAVFRFSQGLEAGVNRMRWGPDGALYIGGVGMVGGWSWKEKKYGLQKIKYNKKITFEMLAVRAKKKGFEIEFTEPLSDALNLNSIILRQWGYVATSGYGGPKQDLKSLQVNRMEISADKKRVYLEIPGIKKQHVVYFRLPDDLKSSTGQPLWSSEAWYTLNNIPE